MTDASAGSQAALEIIDTIYGSGFSANFAGSAEPYLQDTRDHLFGEIWARPGLQIRDRRLLSLAVVASLGQADLFSLHSLGALRSGDVTAEQLHEIVLHLAYYAGGINGTLIRRGALEAIAKFETEREPPRS